MELSELEIIFGEEEDDDDDDDHDTGCSDYCDGSIEVDGGFATAPCLCWCHTYEQRQ